MRRPIRVVTSLALLVSLFVPAATSFAASISVSPTSGPIGSSATVSGAGFAANTTVRVFLVGTGGAELGNQPADASGSLPGLTVMVPNVTGGTRDLLATDGTNTASTSFSVPFSLTLSPTSGAPGTTVTVSGSGFLNNESVSIAWDQSNSQLTTATVAASGSFTASFVAPNGIGNHQVLATGQTSQFVLLTTFSLSGAASVGGAALTINPSSGAAGSRVNLSGTGFLANEQLNVAVDGNNLTSLSSDASGNFTTTVRLPSTLAFGNHTIGVTGASSGRSASVVFAVTSGSRGQAPLACTSENTRRGNGFGDRNHCHTGSQGDRGHGHGDQGDDDQGDDD